MAEVIVIGGGASGLAAAIAAADNLDNHVTVLEKQGRVGRKLLATGNGRCNLTNVALSPENYHGEEPAFAMGIISDYYASGSDDFFERLGLLTTTEYGGRVYPKSNFAGSVLDVLRHALELRGVETLTDCAVGQIVPKPSGFDVVCEGKRLHADKVIVACGGIAGAKLGGAGDGYELLKALGHSCTKLYPSLTQIRTEGDFPRAVKGVRANVDLRLKKGGETVRGYKGEVQFTETGVSGTAAFEVSRFAAAPPFADVVELDFFPGMSDSDVQDYFVQQKKIFAKNEKNRVLTGSVHPRLGLMLCKAAGLDAAQLCESLSNAEIENLISTVKHFTLKVTGVSGFEAAQVTAGGIRTSEFDNKTLESRLCKNLYACGEVLDVDGDCGGYNLQWAWASGVLAGKGQ